MKRIPSIFVLLLLSMHLCHAGPCDGKAETIPVQAAQQASPFDEGSCEIDFSGSYFHSIVFSGRPKFNWSEGDLSWGRMLYSPSAPGWLRGNWEFLANGFGGGVTKGPGNYLTGGRALLRYNFVQPEAKLIPFVQLGGGGLLNDAFRDRSQRMIGGEFEFTLVADIGLRYFVAKNWALFAMGDFQHVSNADTHPRNLGSNAPGFTFGAGYFY